MAHSEDRSLDEIWQGDLFNRREEAVLLQAYIESVTSRTPLREDKRAYTIAIDAGYGEGKSFFLKRFAEHMGKNHPVAFVDAWSDDLADQPLTALAATLNEALKPFMAEPEIKSRVATFMRKSGQVAKIAGLGLFRRGLATVFTAEAVNEFGEVMLNASDAVKDSVADGLKDVGQGLTDDTVAAITRVSSHDLMDTRVAEFEAGRAAVQAMKNSLSAIVDALDQQQKHPPIIIVIDELDRCRPTYAIKLLEEIKHLFDVPGLVFVLGIHTRQLAHSVSGAYGATFDGHSYLRRFIDRQYTLALPDHYRLLSKLCNSAGVNDSQLAFMSISHVENGGSASNVPEILTLYMKMYGLAARDAFGLIDILQTSIALAQGMRLHGAYLVPLVIGHMRGLAPGILPEPVREIPFVYVQYVNDGIRRERRELKFDAVAESFSEASKMTQKQLISANENNPSFGVMAINNTRNWHADPLPLWDVSRYPILLAAVGRFSDPARLSPD